MSKPLTMKDLEECVCECNDKNCDNTTIFFNQKCHRGAGVEVSYSKGSGEIEVTCCICHMEIATIAIAQCN